jgi:hypothetical protein
LLDPAVELGKRLLRATHRRGVIRQCDPELARSGLDRRGVVACPLSGQERKHMLVASLTGFVESPGGVSPPGAPRTVREPLDSYGSRCSAVAMT